MDDISRLGGIIWNREAIRRDARLKSVYIPKLPRCNLAWVGGAIVEVCGGEIPRRVGGKANDEVTTNLRDSESAHNGSLGDVIASSSHVKVAWDRDWTLNDPSPVVAYAERDKGLVHITSAGGVPVGGAIASAGWRGW